MNQPDLAHLDPTGGLHGVQHVTSLEPVAGQRLLVHVHAQHGLPRNRLGSGFRWPWMPDRMVWTFVA